jgi:hypothetical protein
MTFADWTGLRIPAPEAEALTRTYRDLARNIAAFPEAELKAVEPPLRSTPAWEASPSAQDGGARLTR